MNINKKKNIYIIELLNSACDELSHCCFIKVHRRFQHSIFKWRRLIRKVHNISLLLNKIKQCNKSSLYLCHIHFHHLTEILEEIDRRCNEIDYRQIRKIHDALQIRQKSAFLVKIYPEFSMTQAAHDVILGIVEYLSYSSHEVFIIQNNQELSNKQHNILFSFVSLFLVETTIAYHFSNKT